MIERIKVLPEKTAAGIGLTLIVVSGLFSFESWTVMIVRGIVIGIATLFILSVADKRHSRIDKKSKDDCRL